MRRSRRNIPDEFSPQNPLNKTDITPDRIQDELEDKIPVEDVIKEVNEPKKDDDLTTDEILRREQLRKQSEGER
jgi:hypothetical protein